MQPKLRSFPLLLGSLFLIVFCDAIPAAAADLQVSALEVLSSGGAIPVAGARVCVGTQANPTQVGSLVINTTGAITFNNIPNGEWLVTVSASGYRGQQRTINITGNYAAAAFSMERCTGGNCGPVCDGGSTSGKSLSVEVTRTDLINAPVRIAGAKVCVGTSSDYGLYGVAATGPAGENAVITGIPGNVSSVVVTASAPGHQSNQQTVDISGAGENGTATTLVKLLPGINDPICRRKLPFEPEPQALIKINKFEINRGNEWTNERKVGLFATLEGAMPTQYQVSESPEFTGATWLEFSRANDPQNNPFAIYDFDSGAPQRLRPITDINDIRRIPPGGIGQPVSPLKPKYGNRTLYLRFRVGNVVSAAKSDSIELRPKMKIYSVTGDEVKTLLRRARDEWGFSFSASVTDEGPNKRCAILAEGEDRVSPDIPGLRLFYNDRNILVDPEGKTVRYRIFSGRNLNRYWQIKDFYFQGGENYGLADPSKSGFKIMPTSLQPHIPERIVEFTYFPKSDLLINIPNCVGIELKLIGISLEGPEDMEWQDAFRRE